MKNLTLLFTCCLLLVVACKDKDDDATSAPVPATDYFPLTQGSYWIYQWYKLDALGNESIYNRIDTITVVGKTTINGAEHAILEGTHFGAEVQYFYRDSSGYLVEENGSTPIFSTAPSSFLGNDTTWLDNAPLYWEEHFMQPDLVATTVPAGSFEDCIVQTTVLHPLELTTPYGDRATPYYYAKGVGLVKHQIFFYSSPDYLESRLVEYHINE